VSRVRKESIFFIHRAYRAVGRRRYAQALSFLLRCSSDPYLRDLPYYDYLTCIVYILTDKFANAAEILRSAERLYPDYQPFAEIRAYLAVKSALTVEVALVDATEQLQKYPDSHHIVPLVRRLERTSNFSAFQKSLKLRKVITIPAPPGYRRPFPVVGVLGGIVVAVLISGLTVTVLPVLQKHSGKILFHFPWKKSPSYDFETYRLSGESYALLDPGAKGELGHYDSEQELAQEYEAARKLAKDEKYNESVVLLNKILHSNASLTFKERTRFLKDVVAHIKTDRYEGAEFGKLKENPLLYDGLRLAVDGKVTNLSESKSGGAFTLLVNSNGDEFEAVLEVLFDAENPQLKNGDMVHVSGQFLAREGAQGTLMIKGEKVEVKQKSAQGTQSL
jgi:hypothetical protein